MLKPPLDSKIVCYSFDYGNRTILKEPLRKLLQRYDEQVLGVMPFVNNNPYLLEFYIIFDCEKDEILEYIKTYITPLAIKEHSELTIEYLLKQLGNRRFNSINHIFPDMLDNFFENFFFFPERKELLSKGYKIDTNLFPPNTIFFSYSHKIEKFVEDIKNELKNYNLPVFVDTSSLVLGDIIDKNIEKLIEESRGVVFFIDKNFYATKWLNYEFDLANRLDKKKFLIMDDNYKEYEKYLYVKSSSKKEDVKKVVKDILRWYYE